MTDAPDDQPPPLVDDAARRSPYAVPMSTLLGGAFVATTDQVQEQPEPAVQDWSFAAGPDGDGGD
jgi:hypothetical protein